MSSTSVELDFARPADSLLQAMRGPELLKVLPMQDMLNAIADHIRDNWVKLLSAAAFTVAGWLLGRWPLSTSRVLAICLGFVGMGLILGAMDGLPIPRNAGDWLALASGMLWSWGTMRSFDKPSPGIALPVFGFAAGGLVSSLGLLSIAGVASLPVAQSAGLWSGLPWIVLAALIVFVPPNFMVLWASQRIDPGRVGILLMTEVLVGALTAALYSGDRFTWADGLGTALIVASGLTEVLGRR